MSKGKKVIDRLAIRVRGVNRANDAANKLYAKLAPFFKEYVGTKICKADGSLLQKIKDKMPALPGDDRNLNVFANGRRYSLSYEVRTWEAEPNPDGQGPDIGFYYSAPVYIGDLSNGVLTKLYDPPNFKTDYDAKVIAEARVAYKQAQEAADAAKAKLFPFDERH